MADLGVAQLFAGWPSCGSLLSTWPVTVHDVTAVTCTVSMLLVPWLPARSLTRACIG
jgi:hypothetical protein